MIFVLLQFDPQLVLVSSGYDSGIGDPEVSNLCLCVLSHESVHKIVLSPECPATAR